MTLMVGDDQCEPVDATRQKIAALKTRMIGVFMDGDLETYWRLNSKMRRLLARRHADSGLERPEAC